MEVHFQKVRLRLAKCLRIWLTQILSGVEHIRVDRVVISPLCCGVTGVVASSNGVGPGSLIVVGVDGLVNVALHDCVAAKLLVDIGCVSYFEVEMQVFHLYPESLTFFEHTLELRIAAL